MIQARKSDADCKGVTRIDKKLHYLVVNFQITLWSIDRNGVNKEDMVNLMRWTDDLAQLPPGVFAQC